MPKQFLVIAALGGLLSVALGAFGAHALEGQLSPHHLATYHKAVDYQAMHSLALFGIGLLLLHINSRLIQLSGWLLLLGTLLFSGSLYLLLATGVKAVAWLTPVGGSALILGWLVLAIGAARIPTRPD